jgi:DNA-binding response OmpR family regulator
MESKKKILLIDDEKDFCFFVKGNLESTGEFEVITTTSGKKGIKLACEEKPDLIFLDLNMPEMSGSEVAQNLRDRSETKKIPLIFLTALITEDEMGTESMANIGGYNYIAKPVTTKELIAVIKKILK